MISIIFNHFNYSVRAITDLIYLKIDRGTYLRARKTSIMKRHGGDLELDHLLSGRSELSPRRNDNNNLAILNNINSCNTNNCNNFDNNNCNNSIRKEIREFSLDNLQGFEENLKNEEIEIKSSTIEANGDLQTPI